MPLRIQKNKGKAGARLKVGDKAPDFTLSNQDGDVVSLRDYAGRGVVVYFYAKDDAPGCAAEARQFNELLPGFMTMNIDVLGISPDRMETHREFRKKHDLQINLLSDSDHEVMHAYGAWEVNVRWNGQMIVKAIRSTVAVGPEGKILASWYDVAPDGHPAQVHGTLVNRSRRSNGMGIGQ